jgi:xanthine dehydrogenase YagS FAD-binding subunit
LLGDPEIAVLAGGTTLVDLMRCGVTSPAGLVDISRLSELREVVEEDGRLRIGACLTMAEVARNPSVTKHFSAVQDALLLAASAQIRNQATVAGNLRQGPRCVFYRDHRAPCTRRDSRQSCSARGATTITPPLLGADEDCVAPYPGDLAVALVAHEALVKVRSRLGTRVVAVEELLERSHPDRQDALMPGELIVGILLPRDRCTSAFVKRRERGSFAFASASAAAAVELADGVVRTARVVIGAQSTRPRRLPEAEQVVVGQVAERSILHTAAAAAVSGMRGPHHEVAWCRDTIAQALNEAVDRATDAAD